MFDNQAFCIIYEELLTAYACYRGADDNKYKACTDVFYDVLFTIKSVLGVFLRGP